jgi:two-component system, cell cycle sensor histidine kinase and response regulator CckA
MDRNEVFESCIEGIIKISDTQVILDVNNSFTDLLGYKPEEIIGKNFQHFTPPEFHHKDIEAFENLAANGFVEEYVKNLVRKNGITIPVSVRLWALYKENEILSYYYAIIREASSLKEDTPKHADLVPLDTNFDILFDNLPVGFAYFDIEKRFKTVNKLFLEILNFDRNRILNRSYNEVFRAGDPFSELIWEENNIKKSYIDDVIKLKKPVTFSKNLHKKHYNISYFPITKNGGDNIEVLMVIDDVSEMNELEKRLRHSQKMESIGSLTGGIAHDFNNILTGILGYAELLRISLPQSDQVAEEIQGIINASNRAKDLIRQLLTFSRQAETKTVVVNITTVLKEIIRLLRGSLPSNIEIYTEYPIDTWNTMADPAQLHQVIMNLCINAQQAMHEGGILRILIQNVEIDDEYCKKNFEAVPGKYISLIVEDTGAGMDEEVKSRLFEPFFTTKSTKGGTGLGLSIVYGIVKSLQGFIELESEVGIGTTFKIYFPAVFRDATEESEIDDNLKGGKEVILFVDDEVPIVEISTSILKNFGYKTLKAFNGLEALEMYKQNKGNVDLIITDLTMPKMSGTNLAKEVIKLDPKAKIILCSGFASSQIITDLKEVGIKEFIQKPLIASIFLNTVRKVLDTPA